MNLTEEVLFKRTLPSPDEARAIRERAGVSQQRLATELGVTRATISRWEHGDRRPRGDQRIAYAQTLAALRAACNDA